MKKETQAKLVDEIVLTALYLKGRKFKVGEAYEKIARRKEKEFVDKVKELPSEAFSASRMSLAYKPDPSPLEQALKEVKENE